MRVIVYETQDEVPGGKKFCAKIVVNENGGNSKGMKESVLPVSFNAASRQEAIDFATNQWEADLEKERQKARKSEAAGDRMKARAAKAKVAA